MKTILCSEYQKTTILDTFAKENHGIVTDIECKTLANYFHTDDNVSTQVLTLEAMHLLKQNSNEFPIYSDMFRYPAFIQEVLSFAGQIALYNIDPETLPQKTSSDKELYGILKRILSLPLKEKEMQRKKDSLIRSLASNPNVSLQEYFETNTFKRSILTALKQSGLPVVGIEKANAPKTFFRYALNTRQEIEAIAQNIAIQGTDATVILTSENEQLPVVMQVFSRYDIPYSVSTEDFVHMPHIYAALLKFAHTREKEDFLNCLRCDAFSTSADTALIHWLEDVMVDLTVPYTISEVLRQSPYAKEADKAEHMEQKAHAFFEKIHDDFTLLVSDDDPSAILKNVYEVFSHSPYLKEPKELQSAVRIRSLLQNVLPCIESTEDLNFVLEFVQSLRKTTNMTQGCVTITDLTHPYPKAANSYIVGCNGKNYPGFPIQKGLFDEAYVKQIPLYPSLNERHAAYMEQLNWVHTSGDSVYYSYAVSDYQGRELQAAYDIEKLFAKDAKEKWNIAKLAPARPREHSIEVSTADSLFKKNNKITGSVSTIERFFNCPYSYFIQSGLHISKFEQGALDPASIGNIQHAVLEASVREHGKQYADISKEEIAEFMRPYFETLKIAHPTKDYLFELTKERLCDSLELSLEFFRMLEENSSFTPTWMEYEFRNEEVFTNILLRGKIDRMDISDNLFRIIDYKSSAKALHEDDIKAGTQLQLLTYLFLAERILQKRPVGCYYANLQDGSSNQIAAKATAKNGTVEQPIDQEAQQSAFLTAKKLSGWTFDHDHLIENDATEGMCIANLKKNFDVAKILECMESLYAYFYDQISHANIALEPKEHACDFCQYKSICRFQGQRIKSVPIVMKGDPFEIKKKGDDE